MTLFCALGFQKNVFERFTPEQANGTWQVIGDLVGRRWVDTRVFETFLYLREGYPWRTGEDPRRTDWRTIENQVSEIEVFNFKNASHCWINFV